MNTQSLDRIYTGTRTAAVIYIRSLMHTLDSHQYRDVLGGGLLELPYITNRAVKVQLAPLV